MAKPIVLTSGDIEVTIEELNEDTTLIQVCASNKLVYQSTFNPDGIDVMEDYIPTTSETVL